MVLVDGELEYSESGVPAELVGVNRTINLSRHPPVPLILLTPCGHCVNIYQGERGGDENGPGVSVSVSTFNDIYNE